MRVAAGNAHYLEGWVGGRVMKWTQKVAGVAR